MFALSIWFHSISLLCMQELTYSSFSFQLFRQIHFTSFLHFHVINNKWIFFTLSCEYWNPYFCCLKWIEYNCSKYNSLLTSFQYIWYITIFTSDLKCDSSMLFNLFAIILFFFSFIFYVLIFNAQRIMFLLIAL